MNENAPAGSPPENWPDVLREDWYHSIELAPGFFTPGNDHQNIRPTRQMLRGCRIAGMHCLDVGTMDALMGVLLGRRGAASVTCHDIVSRRRQVDLVQRALGCEHTPRHP